LATTLMGEAADVNMLTTWAIWSDWMLTVSIQSTRARSRFAITKVYRSRDCF
jgi:hypothetical protein